MPIVLKIIVDNKINKYKKLTKEKKNPKLLKVSGFFKLVIKLKVTLDGNDISWYYHKY